MVHNVIKYTLLLSLFCLTQLHAVKIVEVRAQGVEKHDTVTLDGKSLAHEKFVLTKNRLDTEVPAGKSLALKVAQENYSISSPEGKTIVVKDAQGKDIPADRDAQTLQTGIYVQINKPQDVTWGYTASA